MHKDEHRQACFGPRMKRNGGGDEGDASSPSPDDGDALPPSRTPRIGLRTCRTRGTPQGWMIPRSGPPGPRTRGTTPLPRPGPRTKGDDASRLAPGSRTTGDAASPRTLDGTKGDAALPQASPPYLGRRGMPPRALPPDLGQRGADIGRRSRPRTLGGTTGGHASSGISDGTTGDAASPRI